MCREIIEERIERIDAEGIKRMGLHQIFSCNTERIGYGEGDQRKSSIVIDLEG